MVGITVVDKISFVLVEILLFSRITRFHGLEIEVRVR
jgi:hypothetical protein